MKLQSCRMEKVTPLCDELQASASLQLITQPATYLKMEIIFKKCVINIKNVN